MFPSLIEDLFVTVRPLADDYGSELSLEMEPDEPFTIVSDPRRVRQILLNLLSNAIKFGEGRAIRVRCKRNENKGVEIEVIDQGVGIANEDTSRIFEEFVQVSESKQPGTGLGLPISRRLAQLLDGSLTVESVPGQGSAFRLTLPPSLEDDLAPAAELSAASAA
jgi:signal transduction histidine kinase